MRVHVLPLTAFALAGALGFSGLALAQSGTEPAAPPAQSSAAPVQPPFAGMRGPGPGMGPGAMGQHWGGMHHMGGQWEGQREGQWRGPHHWRMGERAGKRGFMRHADTWGLFEHHADLALSPADVQTIAEAILLRHGQHDWKVGDVTPNADHTVSFAFVTAHGDVVARFTMDTTTGRIIRVDD